MQVAEFLSQRGVRWELSVSQQSMVIQILERQIDARRIADELLDECVDFLAQSAAKLNLEDARIRWSAKRGHEHRVPATWSSYCELGDFMADPFNSPNRFVWFGGSINETTALSIQRMRESDEPMGLVLPTIDGGILKTIQLGINRASIDLFGFNAHSLEDMRSAIQRDTTNDWYPEDLETKRQLFQHSGTQFEQLARIHSKDGWFLMRFSWERVEGSNLVIGRGQQESEKVERPGQLMLA